MDESPLSGQLDRRQGVDIELLRDKDGFSFMTLLSSIIITSLIRNLLGTRSNISFT